VRDRWLSKPFPGHLRLLFVWGFSALLPPQVQQLCHSALTPEGLCQSGDASGSPGEGLPDFASKDGLEQTLPPLSQ
jgi:hypothetical protein